MSVYRGLETQINNKTVPPNSRAQKLFRTSSFYFLLLLLRPFPRSNYQRSLLLTFTFTSVSAQQLPEVLTSYFYFYVRFHAATTVVDGGDIFGIWRVGEEIWVRFFWAKGLGGSWFLFFSWTGGWGWGSRGLTRWKGIGVGNAKDRVGGIDGVHYAPGSH